MYQTVIVEDDPTISLLHRTFLARDNRFALACAFSNGHEALEWLLHHTADLIILDVYMPRISGQTLCRQPLSAGPGYLLSAPGSGLPRQCEPAGAGRSLPLRSPRRFHPQGPADPHPGPHPRLSAPDSSSWRHLRDHCRLLRLFHCHSTALPYLFSEPRRGSHPGQLRHRRPSLHALPPPSPLIPQPRSGGDFLCLFSFCFFDIMDETRRFLPFLDRSCL